MEREEWVPQASVCPGSGGPNDHVSSRRNPVCAQTKSLLRQGVKARPNRLYAIAYDCPIRRTTATLPLPSPCPRAATGHLITISALPQADGLYDPRYEHDACGVAMIARLDNQPDHGVIHRALTALDNLEHRGAEGADIRTGDGAGILVQVPDAFFREV